MAQVLSHVVHITTAIEALEKLERQARCSGSDVTEICFRLENLRRSRREYLLGNEMTGKQFLARALDGPTPLLSD